MELSCAGWRISVVVVVVVDVCVIMLLQAVLSVPRKIPSAEQKVKKQRPKSDIPNPS